MKKLPIGSRSLLYGSHCLFIHPWYVAWAWIKLFGWPKDLAIWCSFFLHDLGYWGKEDIDGDKGIYHPYYGALLLSKLFDKSRVNLSYYYDNDRESLKNTGWYATGIISDDFSKQARFTNDKWFKFSAGHSRAYANMHGLTCSKLCYADKLAVTLEPKWLYMLKARLTGELNEFYNNKAYLENYSSVDEWYEATMSKLRKWVYDNAHSSS